MRWEVTERDPIGSRHRGATAAAYTVWAFGGIYGKTSLVLPGSRPEEHVPYEYAQINSPASFVRHETARLNGLRNSGCGLWPQLASGGGGMESREGAPGAGLE